jgi:hypothetical protein
MNKQTYTIVRAYGEINGAVKQIGWDVMSREKGYNSDNWCNRYGLLRDAKAALAKEGLKATVLN